MVKETLKPIRAAIFLELDLIHGKKPDVWNLNVNRRRSFRENSLKRHGSFEVFDGKFESKFTKNRTFDVQVNESFGFPVVT